ncbi:HAMP domain-containing histidine kinase [Rhodobacteraceae bacterium NNCM2]|nr:HAMP domain-containing histidine kinase [Coraliihabitans acroporae]
MPFFKGLSGRLLVLTVIVVMLVEVAVFVPSVSQFRNAYLTERLARAQIASLTLLAAPANEVPEELVQELLDNAEVVNIVFQRDGVRQFILGRDRVPMVSQTFDMRTMDFWDMITDSLRRMVAPTSGEVIRVIGVPPKGGGELIEITLDPAPLKAAMLDYGWRILRLSLIISLITAGGVFMLIRWLVVAPLLRVTDNVTAFRENPEDPSTTITPSMKSGEIADAEVALAEMQQDVRRALKERARLASLGEAVAKISHDLRNILGSLQLMVDRLERSSDPVVGRVMPKMIGSLDRAIGLCARTLDFGKAEEPEPEICEVALRAMVEDVAEGLGLIDAALVECRAEIAPGYTVPADPEQLHRVLTNLMRNAAQAIAASGRAGTITVSAQSEQAHEVVQLADTGPGMPKRAMENIFKPFKGGVTRGGSGLGLAIAHEIVSAHGGRLELVSTTTAGTVFAIRLPRK